MTGDFVIYLCPIVGIQYNGLCSIMLLLIQFASVESQNTLRRWL